MQTADHPSDHFETGSHGDEFSLFKRYLLLGHCCNLGRVHTAVEEGCVRP